MARTARKRSESGIYHAMLRGINRQEIFIDDEDRIKFVNVLKQYKEKSKYILYAYCLMGNQKGKRNEVLRAIKQIDGVTIRQISRVTGISRSVIDRA